VPARSPRPFLFSTLAAVAALLALNVPLASPATANTLPAAPLRSSGAVHITASEGPLPSPSADASGASATPRAVDLDTAFFLAIARSTAASAAGKVDISVLEGRIAHLDDPEALSVAGVAASLDALRATTAEVAQARNAYDAAQAAAVAAAEALAQANTPEGAKATARQMAADRYGWGGSQFSCLSSLWQKESGWDYQAYNSGSGATGIPQSLPGNKMASAGADWQSNAATQIAWGLGYIAGSYGSPCAAWGHSQATDWY
jgi:hypothetical protein